MQIQKTMKEKQLRGYKFCLHKAYFDTGMGLTNYVKYLIAFFGLASADVKLTLIIAVAYGILSYFLGRWWFQSKMRLAEAEVGNQFNLFVKEMRKKKHL